MLKSANDYLQNLFNVRRDEWLPVLLAGLFFFCVLTALMVLRPAREALGIQRGIEALRWVFFGTAFVTLLINPVFGWLVSRLRRRVFITATYGFFMFSLFLFYLFLMFAPEAVGVASGYAFYIWFSAFNFFSTMLFWAVMADCFNLEQSKRFFALIAVGGTAGAIVGPALTSILVQPLGTAALLLVAIGFLGLAICAALALTFVNSKPSAGRDEKLSNAEQWIIGGSAWAGVRAIFRSPYLLGIASYVIIIAVITTFIYFTRLQMVAAMSDDLDTRTGIFARIDLITQVATLLLQAVIAGHLMKRFGIAVTLTLLPLTVVLGFVGLAVVGSLAALVVFESCYRAVQRGLTRPARETLFTVVSREDKYKAKAFIDTFVYRAGDIVGAQTEGLLGRLAVGLSGLATVAIALSAVWAALGIWLGRSQLRFAQEAVDQAGANQDARGESKPT